MLFNSLTFVVFFVVVLALYYSLKSWRAQKLLLLLASYLFYAAWNPPFVILVWISTVIDWFVARRLETTEGSSRRRGLLLISLGANLGLLGFFKYGGFALENFTALLNLAGIPFEAAKPNIVLPVGISFYTFQTLSYTLDVYFKKINRCQSFLDFAMYVTFFPQLVAGPIVRARDFLPQCVEPKRASIDQLGWGLYFMTLGLFQKVVLADGMLSKAADTVFGWQFGPVHVVDAWIGVVAFAGQIFCDFAGYSTTAIGAALCFGFILPDNFRAPYAAIGFSDFWRRWHITLSSWLRDYLYIPLGGNRHGTGRTYINLMATMLIGGLWHGASWTFVAWGGLHGLYLVIERPLIRIFRDHGWVRLRPVRMFLGLFTFVLVCFTWVFFRAADFPSAGLLILCMLNVVQGGAQVIHPHEFIQVVVVIAGLLGAHIYLREKRIEHAMEQFPSWLVVGVWVVMLCSVILMQGGANAFIYFQF